MAERGVTPVIAGVTRKLPLEGLEYEAGFLGRSRALNESRVRPRNGPPLGVFRLDADAVRRAREVVDGWPVERLVEQLVHKLPNLVSVAVAGTEAKFSSLLPPMSLRRQVEH